MPASLRQTCATSGVNGIALTKLDVLDGFETLKICVAYELDGQRLDYLPTAATNRRAARPSTRRCRDGRPRPRARAAGPTCRARR